MAVVVCNLLFGYLIDRTKTAQGKARPYILLSALLIPVAGTLLFLIPDGNTTAMYALVVISFNLFFAIAYAIYNSAYNLLVPLSSRNGKTRNTLSTLANLGMMIAQTIGSLFPSLIYPFIGNDKNLWFLAMMGFSILTIPFILLQYYHTRERVTEETMMDPSATAKTVKIPPQKAAICCFEGPLLVDRYRLHLHLPVGPSLQELERRLLRQLGHRQQV